MVVLLTAIDDTEVGSPFVHVLLAKLNELTEVEGNVATTCEPPLSVYVIEPENVLMEELLTVNGILSSGM